MIDHFVLSDGTIEQYDYNGLANKPTVDTNGVIMRTWTVTPSVSAVLYNNGKFVVIGTGEAGANFSASNLPPWNNNKYMRCIKSIEFDNRITYKNLQFWFTQYDSNGDPIYYNNEYTGSLVLPRNTASLGANVFGQLDCHHFNLCNVVTNGNIDFAPNAHKKFILSVPSSLCETTNIISSITNTAMPTVFQNNASVNNPTALMVVITDSSALHDAILDKIDELVSSRGSLCNAWTNCLCIKCDDLAPDGFPSDWTEPMKRCILEIIPYLGRQSLARETNEVSSSVLTFAYDGLTTLGNYSGYGYPHVFSPKALADIFTSTKATTRRFAEEIELGELTNYLGQPYSTELGNMASGLSCSGLVSFIFWRYFNENFSLATSKCFVTNKGRVGNNLPLVEIQRDDVKPFDLCCMAYDQNEDGELTDADSGGHVAIVLDTREVDGEKVIYILQSLMGIGIVFGTWKYETETGKIVKYKRLSKGGISENMIT